MAESNATTVTRPGAHPAPASSDFPGCRPVRIPQTEIADYEGRIEYWDAATELEGVSTAALVQAALDCRDEPHFLRLARERG